MSILYSIVNFGQLTEVRFCEWGGEEVVLPGAATVALFSNRGAGHPGGLLGVW